MLAVPAERAGGLPKDGALWAYEVKWDGMRVLADVVAGECASSQPHGTTSPSRSRARGLADEYADMLLDGEIV